MTARRTEISIAISTEFRTLDTADRLPDNYVNPYYLAGLKEENLSRPHWREAVRISMTSVQERPQSSGSMGKGRGDPLYPY